MSSAVRDWAPTASAALAALAATASWVSVRANRRQWLLASRPCLSSQLEMRSNGDIEMTVLNAGPGSARGLRFCVVAGDQFATGYAGPQYGGVLGAQERAVVVLRLKSRHGEQVQGVVLCWDPIGRLHCFTMHGEHRLLRSQRRGPDPSEPQAAYLKLYGKRSLDGLQRVDGHGPRRD